MISKKKKKKKGLRQISGRFFSQFRKFKRLRGALFVWGGYFPFFTENRPQKHKKHAFLLTSQANGGARAPPAPPLATLLCWTINVARNFDWGGGQTTSNDVIRHFRKKNFCGTKIEQIGRSEAVACVFYIIRILLTRESLNPPKSINV